MRNSNKFPKIHNGEGNRKLIRNLYPGPDHYQKLIISRGSSPLAQCPCLPCLVDIRCTLRRLWVILLTDDRMTERTIT